MTAPILAVLFFHTTLMAIFLMWLWRKRARNFQRQNKEYIERIDELEDLCVDLKHECSRW